MYSEIFDKFLRDLAGKSEIGNIYRHLFALLTADELEIELQRLHLIQSGKDEFWKEAGKEEWFRQWHKTIRQCDYFNNCYQKQNKRILSLEERQTIVDLNKYFYKNELSEVDKQKRKDDEKDKFSEYHRLRRLQEDETRPTNISGIMDSLLYNTIHLDENNELFKVFQRIFLEVEMEKQTVQ